MKNAFLSSLVILILLCGCSASREASVSDTSTKTTETEKKETFRRGDTITAYNPFYVKHKDTTIYTYSYETKSVIRETYDKEGNQQIDCITDDIRELIETTKILVENNIESNTKSQTSFDPASLIWSIAGLGIVVLLILVFGLIAFSKMQKAIPSLVANAVKEAIR